MVIYLDDILIFSKDPREHEEHVWLVLQKLREHRLYAKLEKCFFDRDIVEFLVYIVSPTGISMDMAKVQTIVNW